MSLVVVTELDRVAFVKLNRPDVRNAFNPQMIEELTKTFASFEKRKDIMAVAFSGEGKAFCAGADLAWMRAMVNYSLDQNRQDADVLFQMFETIANCPVPIVGHVHGAVFGGALGLVACCDIVIAEEDTQFCFSEVKLGIVPAVISAFLNRKANMGHVRPYMLNGQIFGPSKAADMGLVHAIVPRGEGHSELQRQLHGFADAGPEAVREMKKLLSDLTKLDWAGQREKTSRVISERRVSTEGQEGLKSFVEKRAPAWRDR